MHVFLTGEKGIGKSTLLKKAAESSGLRLAGFCTVSEARQENRPVNIYMVPFGEDPVPEVTPVVGVKKVGGNPAVFDTWGVEIIKKAEATCPQLFIMDELGFMESDALKFQNEILRILDSGIPVLGVIKPRESAFLNSIRARDDVKLIEITIENRDFWDGKILK